MKLAGRTCLGNKCKKLKEMLLGQNYWVEYHVTLEHSASGMRDRSQSSGLTVPIPGQTQSPNHISAYCSSLLLFWPNTKVWPAMFAYCSSLPHYYSHIFLQFGLQCWYIVAVGGELLAYFISMACNTGPLQQFCLH